MPQSPLTSMHIVWSQHVTTTSQQPNDLDGSSDTDAHPICKWLPRDVPNLQSFLEPFRFGMTIGSLRNMQVDLRRIVSYWSDCCGYWTRKWRKIPRSLGKCHQATPTQRSPCMVMKQRSGQLLIKYLTNECQIMKLSKAFESLLEVHCFLQCGCHGC